MPDTDKPDGQSALALAAYASDFVGARQQFREAAAQAGAVLASLPHPQTGPDGADLSVDLAWLGPLGANRVLVLISGTHGVEGYQGSAAQIGFLQTTAGTLPADTAALLIHGLNPYGFAWVRRVNEDNVDINRNYLDFSRPLPANPGYAQVHDLILPEALAPAALAQLQQQLLAYMARVGKAAAATAITGGQYTHPHGIFYGGQAPCWSKRQLGIIARCHLQSARLVWLLGHHTRLGAVGHTQLI
ncbi:MAG: M14 family metallopeptidase, partial [Rhodoferax sp.]|nr:M14 family metallopeptidase [Rhodoferax sp.]